MPSAGTIVTGVRSGSVVHRVRVRRVAVRAPRGAQRVRDRMRAHAACSRGSSCWSAASSAGTLAHVTLFPYATTALRASPRRFARFIGEPLTAWTRARCGSRPRCERVAVPALHRGPDRTRTTLRAARSRSAGDSRTRGFVRHGRRIQCTSGPHLRDQPTRSATAHAPRAVCGSRTQALGALPRPGSQMNTAAAPIIGRHPIIGILERGRLC